MQKKIGLRKGANTFSYHCASYNSFYFNVTYNVAFSSNVPCYCWLLIDICNNQWWHSADVEARVWVEMKAWFSQTWSLSTWTLTPPMLPFLKEASMSNTGLKRLPLRNRGWNNSMNPKKINERCCDSLSRLTQTEREMENDEWADKRRINDVSMLLEGESERAIIGVYYLMLSSRMRTRKSGRPCIFQHCLMNCNAFYTHTHTNTHVSKVLADHPLTNNQCLTNLKTLWW